MYRKGSRKGTVEFVVWPTNGEREVFVAGDFSEWKPLAMKKRKDGLFSAVVPAPSGTYEYKFLVDGQWLADPDHSNWAKNPFGSMNSVATIR